MKRLLALPLALALVSCGQEPDGYIFKEAEFKRTEQTVKIVEYQSLTQLRAAAPEQAKTEGRELHAFAYIWPDRCDIHVAPLTSSEARMWLGHEMTHCVYGRWHD